MIGVNPGGVVQVIVQYYVSIKFQQKKKNMDMFCSCCCSVFSHLSISILNASYALYFSALFLVPHYFSVCSLLYTTWHTVPQIGNKK